MSAKVAFKSNIKVFKLKVAECANFDIYSQRNIRPQRTQFNHDIYFNADTEEQLFNAMKTGLIPDELHSVGQVIGWLMLKGIERMQQQASSKQDN